MYYPVHTPGFVHTLFPSLLWRVPTQTREVYLTFDDGPTSGVTEQVLSLLHQNNAKATFFLVGNNAARHPERVRQMVAEGHTLGNHTYNHVSGWRVSQLVYADEIRRTDDAIANATGAAPTLFRAPYGQLPPRYAYIQHTHRIVMWDVLAADWDTQYTPEQCLQNVLRHWQPGSIIVLHDSVKCAERCLYVLLRLLSYFEQQGVLCKPLPA